MANNEFEKFNKDLGKQIQNLRVQRGLTQEELAELVGMDRVSIGYIEQGIRAPKLSTLLRISKALKISIQELLPR